MVVALSVLSVLGLGAAVFVTRGKRIAPTKTVAPLQSRRLVTLLLKCPGPTAPIQEMWRKTAAVVDKPIPDVSGRSTRTMTEPSRPAS